MYKLLISCFITISFAVNSQDTLNAKNEIGIAVNRYLPDLTDEHLPYFFGAEYRRKFKKGEKYDHFIILRAAGNRNRLTSFKPYTAKLFLAGEIGYHARVRKEDSKWLWSFGANLGMYNVKEFITPQNINQFSNTSTEPYTRSYFKIGFSPRFGVEYALSESNFVQLQMSIGFGSRYRGDITHLDLNSARGFSAQFPSLGIYHKF